MKTITRRKPATPAKSKRKTKYVYMVLSWRMPTMRMSVKVDISIYGNKHSAEVNECALRYEGYKTTLERKEVKA